MDTDAIRPLLGSLLSNPNGKEPQIGDFPFAGECGTALDAVQSWKNRLLDSAVDRPLETLLTLVSGSALVLYLAERDVNEGINTYDDAFYYISTCLSVGYANVFPKTQLGKFVAAMVMIIGPSLSSWVVEGRLIARQQEEAGAGAESAPALAPVRDMAPVVEKLDAILQELRAQRTETA